MCVRVFFPFILDVRFVGRTSRGHIGFPIHLPSAVHALIFLARRIQPFLSLLGREVYRILCTNDLIVLHLLGFFLFFSEENSQLPGFELTSQRVRRFRGYQLSYRGDRYAPLFPTPTIGMK